MFASELFLAVFFLFLPKEEFVFNQLYTLTSNTWH